MGLFFDHYNWTCALAYPVACPKVSENTSCEIPIYIQQGATLQCLFYLETALHVSGGTSTHHQERKQPYLQHLLFVTPLLLPAATTAGSSNGVTHHRYSKIQAVLLIYLSSQTTSNKNIVPGKIKCLTFHTPPLASLFNPLNPELNPICSLLALLGAHHFLHVSRIRVKLLTFRRLMSYIYIWSTNS